MKTAGWMDSNKVHAYLTDGKDSHKKHLGLINLFNTTHDVQVPFMKDLFEGAAVLECDEGETITYDLPVNRKESKCYTAEDMSTYTDYPGIDGNVFKIILSHEFTKGDILTYDPQFGQNLMVSEDHEVERVGDNFLHYVTMNTNDKTKYYPKDKLKAGIQYMKIGNALAEFSTAFSSINMIKNPTGSVTNEFILGSPRGVETFYTSKASKMKSPGLTQFSEDMMDTVQGELDALGGKDKGMFFMAKKAKNGKGIQKDTLQIGFTLEYLALMELTRMEAHSLLFSRAATVQTSNGVKRINEGVWHQMRRGKLIQYSRPGGINLNHIHEAASYIYKNSKMSPAKRVLKFKAGWFAYQNALQLFREQAVSQLGSLPAGMLGNDNQFQGNLFEGSLDNLKMQAVMIKGVTFPGIGMVEVEHDESLDYMPLADRFSAGMFGESKAWTSHSLVIWDVTDSRYSNVENKVERASLVEGGNKNANIYYVKPKEGHMAYGYSQGRMPDSGQYENVKSTMKVMGREFWATSQSGALVLDTTRFVTIELDRERN
jgi:hypothetical protein